MNAHSVASWSLLACWLIPAGLAASAELQRGRVGYWSCDKIKDGRVEDSSGSGAQGALLNDPSLIPGVVGQALSFPEKDDKVEALHAPSIDLGHQGQSYTVSFWFRSVALPRDPPDAHFITKFGDPYPFSFVQVASGFVQMRTHDSSPSSYGRPTPRSAFLRTLPEAGAAPLLAPGRIAV